MAQRTRSLVEAARQFAWVRETLGPNRGIWVEIFQKYVEIPPGSSWCAAFLCFCVSIAYSGLAPWVKSGSCADLLAQCRTNGWIINLPIAGDIYFYIDETGHAHHCGVVTQIMLNNVAVAVDVQGIAGNTSADGHSSDGDRVAEHELAVAPRLIVYAALPQ